MLDQFGPDLIGTNVGYFVLGYYLYKYPISVKYQRLIYVSGIVGLIGAVSGSALSAWLTGVPTGTVFDSFSVFTFAASVAIYVFFQEVVGKKDLHKGEKIIKELSANTLGIYLIHILVIECLNMYGIHSMIINNIIGIPMFAIACFVIGGLAAALLRRIPFVGKYIC